eukprot:TRINITY_DN5061_c1_g3_i3.p1 TRINITY_DN5061_c1_g3~~TRINITY_DN5061_c1_g3_i3.p1  ORF type:complete len:955 (+),score=200.89 TRINITY_DN5061_c1_g3_i3:49-2913(+)
MAERDGRVAAWGHAEDLDMDRIRSQTSEIRCLLGLPASSTGLRSVGTNPRSRPSGGYPDRRPYERDYGDVAPAGKRSPAGRPHAHPDGYVANGGEGCGPKAYRGDTYDAPPAERRADVPGADGGPRMGHGVGPRSGEPQDASPRDGRQPYGQAPGGYSSAGSSLRPAGPPEEGRDGVPQVVMWVVVDLGERVPAKKLFKGDGAAERFGSTVAREVVDKVGVPAELLDAGAVCGAVDWDAKHGEHVKVDVVLAFPAKGHAALERLAEWLEQGVRAERFPPYGVIPLPRASRRYEKLVGKPADCHMIVARTAVRAYFVHPRVGNAVPHNTPHQGHAVSEPAVDALHAIGGGAGRQREARHGPAAPSAEHSFRAPTARAAPSDPCVMHSRGVSPTRGGRGAATPPQAAALQPHTRSPPHVIISGGPRGGSHGREWQRSAVRQGEGEDEDDVGYTGAPRGARKAQLAGAGDMVQGEYLYPFTPPKPYGMDVEDELGRERDLRERPPAGRHCTEPVRPPAPQEGEPAADDVAYVRPSSRSREATEPGRWGFDAGPMQGALDQLSPPRELEQMPPPRRVIFEYGSAAGGASSPSKVVVEYAAADAPPPAAPPSRVQFSSAPPSARPQSPSTGGSVYAPPLPSAARPSEVLEYETGRTADPRSAPPAPAMADAEIMTSRPGAPAAGVDAALMTSRPAAADAALMTSRPAAADAAMMTSRPAAADAALMTSRPAAADAAMMTSRPAAAAGVDVGTMTSLAAAPSSAAGTCLPVSSHTYPPPSVATFDQGSHGYPAVKSPARGQPASGYTKTPSLSPSRSHSPVAVVPPGGAQAYAKSAAAAAAAPRTPSGRDGGYDYVKTPPARRSLSPYGQGYESLYAPAAKAPPGGASQQRAPPPSSTKSPPGFPSRPGAARATTKSPPGAVLRSTSPPLPRPAASMKSGARRGGVGSGVRVAMPPSRGH